ncbi:MAG: hypothetical protein H6704_03635 [Myxococcales bacterium]|nr:hypothetical protein [Myxococcales bacterium]
MAGGKGPLVAAVGAVIVLGGVVLWQGRRIDALEGRPAPTAAGDPDGEALADLQRRVRTLEEKVVDLESAPEAEPARAAKRTPPAGVARWARAPRGKAADGADEAAPAPPLNRELAIQALTRDKRVKSQLRDLIREEQTAEREARFAKMREALTQRTKQQMDDLAETAGLGAEQRESVESKLLAEQATIGDLFRDARRDGTFMDLRDAIRDIRAATDAEVQAELEPAQYEAYRTMRQASRGPGFGGGPPPP